MGPVNKGYNRPMSINLWYLKIPKIREQVAALTEHYFNENAESVDSPGIIWEAYKMVVRGQVFLAIMGHKKEKRAQLDRLEQEISILEAQLSLNPASEVLHTLKWKQQE